MGSLPYSPDRLLFAVLPYVAVVAFLVLLAARHFRVLPLGGAPQPTPFLGRPRRYGERILFTTGILVILAGHLLGFLVPEQVLLWNGDALRRYILEVSGLIFALLTAVGLLATLARCLFSAEARRGIGPSDWLLLALLLVQVASGIYVAVCYPWGSSWYATSVVPYLRSLIRPGAQPQLHHGAAAPVQAARGGRLSADHLPPVYARGPSRWCPEIGKRSGGGGPPVSQRPCFLPGWLSAFWY